MGSYIGVIKISILFFPVIALLISIPFVLMQYHKYGSISFIRSLIIYSFTLYFICAYFLVILPLPKVSEVALLTTPRMQLIPFSFIFDFINNTSFDITNIHTYFIAIKEKYFFVPLYNIFLTFPFGIYLRYYFKCNLKKVIFCTLLLSLFFELTQLSGLYFIYPRGYRLFDVDDLILNTLGGLIGYLCFRPFQNILPKRDEIDLKAKEKGKKITGFRRTTSFLLDVFLLLVINVIISFIRVDHLFEFSIIFYYFIIPLFLDSRTLGEAFLNIKILSDDDSNSKLRVIFRRLIFVIIYIGIPVICCFIISNITNIYIKECIGFIFIVIMFVIYTIISIKFIFTNKKMLYEKISKTKLISTIK